MNDQEWSSIVWSTTLNFEKMYEWLSHVQSYLDLLCLIMAKIQQMECYSSDIPSHALKNLYPRHDGRIFLISTHIPHYEFHLPSIGLGLIIWIPSLRSKNEYSSWLVVMSIKMINSKYPEIGFGWPYPHAGTLDFKFDLSDELVIDKSEYWNRWCCRAWWLLVPSPCTAAWFQ